MNAELRIKKTDSRDHDFIQLVTELDKYLSVLNGDKDAFYAQFNKIENINHCVIAYFDHQPIACGAMRPLDTQAMEIKRMFTKPNFRRKRVAEKILSELESWAHQLGYDFCILETGKFMPDAIAFYQKRNYQVTDNYGQYIGNEDSLCFKKYLSK